MLAFVVWRAFWAVSILSLLVSGMRPTHDKETLCAHDNDKLRDKSRDPRGQQTSSSSSSSGVSSVSSTFGSGSGGADPREGTEKGQALICEKMAHAYINLGDGGCFPLIHMNGTFKSQESFDNYTAMLCPFAERYEHRTHRYLLYRWYDLATRGEPVWAVNDLAKFCLMGGPPADLSGTAFLEVMGLNEKQKSLITGEEFCGVYFSLPLMFEAIGFDGPGIMMEDAAVSTTWSFKGVVRKVGDKRSGPWGGCNPMRPRLMGGRPRVIGDRRYGRLVLRALLPTYFRYNYAVGKTEMLLQAAESSGEKEPFFPSKFVKELQQVCSTKARGLDTLFSYEQLRAKGLVSMQALDRYVHQCQHADPCNYDADQSRHLSPCDLCKEKKWPYFDPRNGQCWDRQDQQHRSRCDGAFSDNTCTCHRAICWFFEKDFEATMREADNLCRHFIT